ncbi:hypothetical protein [Bradyrhizobium sp. McL0616]|uniref:hypothetical protein n=1 Tax=Bradyrhizobium sp. McL0616 TaxID=3415674 RepID=UPI003CF63A91
MLSSFARTVAIAVAFVGLSPTIAQQFNAIPNQSVIGRIGIGPGSGPAQAIPFSSLPWTVGNTPINGGVNGQILYDNNGKVGEYSASAARTFLGLASLYSAACSSHQWMAAITAGTPGCTQPSFADLSSNIAVSQMNGGTSASSSTMWRGDGTWVDPQTMTFTPTNASPAATSMQQQLQRMPVMCETYSGGCTTANIQQAITDAVSAGRCYQFNGVYNTTTTVSIIGGSGNICLTGKGGLKLTTAGSFSAVLELKNFNGSRIDGNIQLDCNSNVQIVSALKVWSSSSGTSVQYQDIRFAEYSNCRQAIVIGDRTQSALPLSEIVISHGMFFNVARGVTAYSTNAVVGISNMQNVVDPHSSGAWAISGSATCSGTTVTVTVSAGYLDLYDILTGTGFPANTYVVSQSSGSLGASGSYTVNQACTASSAAFTSETRGINVLSTGGLVYTNGGETINTAVNNGFICVDDIMAGAYGACTFTGGAIEAGGLLAGSFNLLGAGGPTGGGIHFVNNRGFIGGLTTTDLIVTDSTFPGPVVVSNNGFFATLSRSGKNITANNSATPIYFDLVSFGASMLQGYAGISGGTQYMTTKDVATGGAALTGTSATQNPGDSIVYFNGSGTFTYTLLPAARYPSRTLYLVNNAAQAVNSASSNIIGLNGSATSSILGTTAGKFVTLVANGSTWSIVAGN